MSIPKVTYNFLMRSNNFYSKKVRPHFIPYQRAFWLLFCIALFLGTLTHSLIVNCYQNGLTQSISQVKLVNTIFQDDPLLSDFIHSNTKSTNSIYKNLTANKEDFAWRLLMGKRILGNDSDPGEVSNLLKEGLGKLISPELTAIKNKTAIEGLISLLSTIGAAPDSVITVKNGTPTSSKDSAQIKPNDLTLLINKAFIAKCISQERNAFLNYQRMKDNGDLDFDKTELGCLENIQPVKVFIQWDYDNNSLENVKRLIYSQFKIADEFSLLSDNDLAEEYRQIDEFVSSVLVAINTDPSVVKARKNIKIYDGIWQWVMFVFFIYAVLLLLRYLNIIKKGTHTLSMDASKTEYLYNLLKSSLPIFGFMGTIAGLMDALLIAYKAPLSQGSPFLSAMSLIDITSALSLAFTTTLMAFLLKFILDLIETGMRIYSRLYFPSDEF